MFAEQEPQIGFLTVLPSYIFKMTRHHETSWRLKRHAGSVRLGLDSASKQLTVARPAGLGTSSRTVVLTRIRHPSFRYECLARVSAIGERQNAYYHSFTFSRAFNVASRDRWRPLCETYTGIVKKAIHLSLITEPYGTTRT